MKIVNEKNVIYEIENLDKMVTRVLRDNVKSFDTLTIEQRLCIASIVGSHFSVDVNDKIKKKEVEIVELNYDVLKEWLKEFILLNQNQINGLIESISKNFSSLYSLYLKSVGYDVVEVEKDKTKYLESPIYTAKFKDTESKSKEFIEIVLVYVNGDVVPFMNPTSKRFKPNDDVIVPIGTGFELIRNVKGKVLHNFITPVVQAHGLAVINERDIENIDSLSLRIIVGFFEKETNEPIFFTMKESTSSTNLH